jgi:hypothetical protein
VSNEKEKLITKLKERAKKEQRSCHSADCDACPAHAPEGAGHPFCGWVSGFLLKEHSPTELGVVLEAVELDGIGPCYAFREIKDGAGEGENLLDIARTFAASGTPVFVAGKNGEIKNMMAEPDALEKMKKVFKVDVAANSDAR